MDATNRKDIVNLWHNVWFNTLATIRTHSADKDGFLLLNSLVQVSEFPLLCAELQMLLMFFFTVSSHGNSFFARESFLLVHDHFVIRRKKMPLTRVFSLSLSRESFKELFPTSLYNLVSLSY